MLLSRYGPLALALAMGCAPSIPKTANSPETDYSVFDPNNLLLPQPNDLTLAQDPSTLPVSAAQKALLTTWRVNGGFPNDQEVPISIDFTSQVVGTTGLQVSQAADLDLTTINQTDLIVLSISSQGTVGVMTLDPIAAADYQTFGDHGTLTLHNKGRARWPAGQEYVVAVRGGPNGIKLKNGNPIWPEATMFLLLQDKDLTDPANQSLIQLQLGSKQAAEAAAAQLEQIRKGYLAPFQAIDHFFPHRELANIQTFKIAPLNSAHVETDPGAGLIPLPSNFLLDPANGGKTVANIPAFGPLAPGIATLDGFSTTAMLIAQTTDAIAIDASTVRNQKGPHNEAPSVAIFDLSNPAAPVKVDPTTYEAEPSAIAQTPVGTACSPATATAGTCFSKLVGLQPGAPAASYGAAAFNTKPLKEKTTYAVVITNRVKDQNGQGLSRSTLGSILLFDDNVHVFAGGASQLQGVDNATAAGIEAMRQQLAPVYAAALADTDLKFARSEISMAYTFRTQTITSPALQLGALPYSSAASALPAVPACPTDGSLPACVGLTPAQAFAHFGVDPAVVPNGNFGDSVFDVNLVTLNLLNPANGAFYPDPTVCANPATGCAELIRATIVIPQTAKVTNACPSGIGLDGLQCAPLVVFHHGLNGGRGDMLRMADAFAAKGMVVAAIDATKFGDRSYCSKNAECATGTCSVDPALAGQGDASPTPGTCVVASGAHLRGAGYNYRPVSASCSTTPGDVTRCGWDATKGGIPVASGDYFVSANFFRTRDTLRQDIVDQSLLVKVLAPTAPPAAGTHYLYEQLKARGVAIHPGQVYFVGQSLGSIEGTVDVAANPRVSKAVLNVGGGTIVDVFTNSPSFQSQVLGLLASIGIQPGTAAYLQFLSLAKWVLDPADPINFARNLKIAPLPNLLADQTGQTAQGAKKVLGQRAECDSTVPDPFNLELYTNIGLSPVSPTQSTVTVFSTDAAFLTPATCVPPPATSPGAVDHGFLTSFKIPTITSQAQSQAAAFLSSDTLPPPVVIP